MAGLQHVAALRNVERHRRLNPAEVLALEPHLKPQQLRGGVRYFDARTNDVRLTLANVIDAERLGGVVANYAVFTGAPPPSNGQRVARVEDVLTATHLDVRARVLVNATGPWSDAVRQLEGGSATTRVQGSKGAHIAVSRDRVGNRDAVTLLHPKDGRVMFALPSGTNTIIGTTDTFTDASPDEVRASEVDVAYLQEAANAFFPDARLRRQDVVSAWAGIRPLMPTTGSSVSASREHAIGHHDGSVTITGGKLTTYRVMARQVVDVVQRVLGTGGHRGRSDRRLLPDDSRAMNALCASSPELRAEIVSGLPYRMGEMRWGVERELACTLGDLLIRRTHLAFETPDNGRAAARRVAGFLGWDAKELERYESEVARMFTIDT